MALADRYKRLEVRTNADTPEEAEVARQFGATGIGLCRTEHMFFEGERINAVREMILADDEAGRRKALAKLLPMQRGDFEGLFREMSGLPVTIRLLDPPLHEFVPHDEAGQRADGHGDEGLAGQDQDARGGPARVQPDARPPRLPAGHHLPRDHRDAGARHLRGRPEHEGPGRRREGRDHGAAGGHGARVQRAGRGHPQPRPPRCSPSAARRCTTCWAR